jgi:hypothetical protein
LPTTENCANSSNERTLRVGRVGRVGDGANEREADSSPEAQSNTLESDAKVAASLGLRRQHHTVGGRFVGWQGDVFCGAQKSA